MMSYGITGLERVNHLEAPDGFSNLVRVGQLWFAGRVLEVRLQGHVNHLNDARDRKNGDRLKLSLQSVGEGFSFLRVSESMPPVVTKEGDGVGTLITSLVIFHSD